MHWTEQQLAEYQQRRGKDSLQQVIESHGFKGEVPTKSKYGNRKVRTDDGTFDSKWEYQRWCELKMMQAGGAISELQRQVPFELIPAANLDGRQLPAVKYIADFVYTKDGAQVVEDAKGMASLPDYKLKRRLMWWLHKIRVVEVRKH